MTYLLQLWCEVCERSPALVNPQGKHLIFSESDCALLGCEIERACMPYAPQSVVETLALPDLKTVTFDANQYQLVPKVPTDAMLDAAACASMQHLIDCIRDPEKFNEIGSEENVRKTHASRYHSMLDAAPTPAAQSAGQEAAMNFACYLIDHCEGETTTEESVQRWLAAMLTNPHYAPPVNGGERDTLTVDQWLDLAQRHANADWNSDRPDGFLTAVKALCTDFANIHSAPVRDIERELGQVIDERDQYHDAADKLANAVAEYFGVEIGEHSNLNCLWQNALDHIAHATKRAADAPQVGNLRDDQVEWVVNDIAELGVKIGQQFFFLYKGYSLVYEDAAHDDGSPMHWRRVFRREFGECAHPINYKNPELIGTVSLDDSEDWQPLPVALTSPAKEQK